ncbi:MAG: methyltransferase domain-containing protein [Alphaproteobacteria bacterium]
MTDNPVIFDRQRVRMHRNRAVRMGGDDFLKREMIGRAIERLEEMNRNFDVTIELGAHAGSFLKSKPACMHTLIQTDISEAMMRQASGLRIVADEERIPIRNEVADLCISVSSLHWVNDLPGVLVQIQRLLKPGGLFLAIMPGGQTLMELRQSFEKAEMEITGGISPRISPFIDARDAAGLLQRTGFSDPVVDSDLLLLEYDHPLKLLKELQAMGEANVLIHSSKHFTPVSVMMLMADIYLREHMNKAGRIPASIELVTMTAWKPQVRTKL